MAYFSYDKLWRSEFYNNVSAKDKMHDINLNQLKFEVHDTFKKNEKITSFEASNPEVDINKGFLDTKLSKKEGQISYIGKDYNEFKLHNNKQSLEDLPIEKAVRTTIQILYDKGLFDHYNNGDAYNLLKDYSLIEANKKRRLDLEEVNDDIMILFIKTVYKIKQNRI